MAIRIQNFGAFGHQSLLPRVVRPAGPLKSTLGVPGPTIPQAELDFQQAKTHLEGVRGQFQSLVSILGQARAEESLAEAQASYDEAYAAYLATLPGRAL